MPDAIGKLILRLTLGILVLLHGLHKFAHGIGGIQDMVASLGLPAALAWGVYVGEVVGPALLILGWYARIGASLIAINMIVAITLAHRGEILSLTQQGGWALELQGMFLFTAVALALTGPGRFSINRR